MSNEGSVLAHLSYPKSEHLKSSEDFKTLLKSLPFPELEVEKVSEFYLKGVDTNSTEALKKAFYEFYGDIEITCPTYHFAKQFAHSSTKRDVFFYEWTYPSRLLVAVGCTKDMGVMATKTLRF